MVASAEPCLGQVTQAGCGAICPRFGRGCYGCFGPREHANVRALSARLQGVGKMPPETVARLFAGIHSNADAFRTAHGAFTGHVAPVKGAAE
jgi:hypothetical protein